jgi:hypothetical protein
MITVGQKSPVCKYVGMAFSLAKGCFLIFFGKFPLYTIKLPNGCVHEDNKTNSKKDYFAVQTKNPHRKMSVTGG